MKQDCPACAKCSACFQRHLEHVDKGLLLVDVRLSDGSTHHYARHGFVVDGETQMGSAANSVN